MEKQRIFYLDFIRAFSIFIIILYHYNFHILEWSVSDNVIFSQYYFGWSFTNLGPLGVSLFIILSGSSLMASTRKHLDLLNFYKKRFISIYPLFYLIWGCTFLSYLIIYKRMFTDAHWVTLLLTLLGLDGFFLYRVPTFYLVGEWFLGLIIMIYSVFPFLRYVFLRYKLFTILICITLNLWLNKYYHGDMDILRFPLGRLFEFIAGMYFIDVFKADQKIMNFFLIGIIMIFLGCFFTGPGLNTPSLIHVPILGLCIFTLLSCIASLTDRIQGMGIIRFLSAYSYGAFLLHHYIILQVLPLMRSRHFSSTSNYLLFAVLLACIYGLSYLLTNISVIVIKQLSFNRQKGEM